MPKIIGEITMFIATHIRAPNRITIIKPIAIKTNILNLLKFVAFLI